MESAIGHIVTFRIDGRMYAVPLGNVTRAVRMVSITPVPDAPPWLSGVVNVAGQIIPVLDMRRRLGLTERSPGIDDRLLILAEEGQQMAAIVDEVTQVVEVDAENVSSPSQYLSSAQPVSATLRCGDDLIMVLDVIRLAPQAQ